MARVRALLRLKQAQDHMRRQRDELSVLHARLRDSEANRENLVQMITHDLRGPLDRTARRARTDGGRQPRPPHPRSGPVRAAEPAELPDAQRHGGRSARRLPAGSRPRGDRARAAQTWPRSPTWPASRRRGPSRANGCASAITSRLTCRPSDGDRGLLARVFANLLNNAFKYTERGEITLDAYLSRRQRLRARGVRGGPAAGARAAVSDRAGAGTPESAFRKRRAASSSRSSTGCAASRAPACAAPAWACTSASTSRRPTAVISGLARGPDGAPGSVFAFSLPVAGDSGADA